MLKSREGKCGAGLIFFNDNGDECGGMTWRGQKRAGSVDANSGLMFDQYDSDQTVGIQYSQARHNRSSGLHAWERSLKPVAEFAQQLNAAEHMKDGPEKAEALKHSGKGCVRRIGGHPARPCRPHAAKRRSDPIDGHEGQAEDSDVRGRPRLHRCNSSMRMARRF